MHNGVGSRPLHNPKITPTQVNAPLQRRIDTSRATSNFVHFILNLKLENFQVLTPVAFNSFILRKQVPFVRIFFLVELLLF